MFKKVLGCLLAATLLLTMFPVSSFAKSKPVLFGDVNLDGEIDPIDVLMLKRNIAGDESAQFSFTNADVNVDSEADPIDVLMIKKFIAGLNILLGPALLTVSFFDGNRLIDALAGRVGMPLGEVPSTEKTSRADAVFAGWYADPQFTTPFYSDAPVSEETRVYAKYDELKSSDLTVSSFAQTDLDTDAGFTVVGTGDISAIQLTPKDGSDPVELIVTGNDPYTVTAKDGFKEGASYELTLPEGLDFVGESGDTLPETVRTASFTIDKEVVDNLQLSDDTHYVQYPDTASLDAGSTVDLAGAKVGDIICFYKTTSPEDRDYKSGNAYANDPETWFKVSAVDGDTVTLAELDDSDSEKLYEIPDNFPVNGELPASGAGILTLDGADSDGYALDTAFYQQMVEEGVTADLAYANQKISVGDFVSIFVSSAAIDGDNDIYFGKITAYDSETGEITYIRSSADEIRNAMDLYVQPVLSGDDLISQTAQEQIERTVLAQVKNSGFAEEAGFMLADMATRTDGFRNMDGVQMLLTDEDGTPLSDEEIALLNIGKSFEIKDGISVTVEIVTSGDQIHFKDKGSVQLGIGIDAQFEVEVEDGGKIVIDLSATFIQELALGFTVNGSLVKTEILGIPVPVGVKIGSSVDLLSYTAVNVDVHAYTVAEEDIPIWEQLKAVITNPEKLIDVLPAGQQFARVKAGLKTVGDVFDKIDEVNEKLEQARDDAEQALSYAEDLEMLWDMVDELQTSNLPTKEAFKVMGETLGKTNISKDLMDMLDITTQTELDAERYSEGLDGILTKYSEMLQQETDWVKLVQKEIFQGEYCYCGIVIYFKADFVVRADMNIAMGTSLQYQVGKRYSFWMKIGLFIPEAGTSTMDLVDEEFAFQFYVMGKLGIKMGIEATVGFAIGSADAARVGVHMEIGPYVKLYGFFIYEYERTREANTSEWQSDERMAGALYLDFGLYLIVGVDAAALNDLFEVSYELVDAEFPLLEAGEKNYPYEFNYEPTDDEVVLVQDEDGNNLNGITMTLPDEYKALSCCNLVTGRFGATAFDWDCYNFSLSNPAFSIDENGLISVDVPDNTRYMECDLTITYKYGKMAFSSYDMQVTIPLVWTNLPTDELTQYYTASVRVGNDTDGYDTVWSTRVRKNQEFTLPTEAELKSLIGYNDSMYASLSFPDAAAVETVIANTSFDCTVAYTDYAVTVNGIQNTDGTTRSETFHTTYGGTFDFSALADTGTSKEGTAETASYTVFSGVTTTATVTANGQEQIIDLSQPVTGKVADAIRTGSVAATAQYGDNSVLVTYVFHGIDAPDYSERIRKGSESDYDFSTVALEKDAAVNSVTPVLGKVNSTTTYYVECSKIVGTSYTLSFEENGGNTVTDVSRVGGSLIGNLPIPEKTGYTFGGWYADTAITEEFTATLMPNENTTVYAKWTANEYTVTLNVNGGIGWTNNESPVTVTYDSAYGALPVPTRDSHSFLGWFTEADGGTQVTAQMIVNKTVNHTLYAHWHELVEIPQSFAYETVTTTYEKGKQVSNLPTFTPIGEEPHRLTLSDFTIRFMHQSYNTYSDTPYPVSAGVWDAVISYAGDDYYAPFEQLCQAVIIINKATRTIGRPDITVASSHFSYLNLKLADGTVDDLHPDAQILFKAHEKSDSLVMSELIGTGSSANATEPAKVSGLEPDTNYAVMVYVTGDPNYEDAVATAYSDAGKTDAPPTGKWGAAASFGTAKTININSEEDLAILMTQTNNGETFRGYTFSLTRDLDMSKHQWTPIGIDENYFMGTFNGNGHTIRGVYTAGGKTAGLFGMCHVPFSVSDLTVEDSFSSGYQYCGGIVGALITRTMYEYQNLSGYITNCTNRATVITLTGGGVIESAKGAGGIAGGSGNSYIRDCVNEGRVTGTGNSGTGGIVGTVGGNVTNCINYGTVKSDGRYTGGLVGMTMNGTVSNSVNFGNVTGVSCVGGITGETYKQDCAIVYNCYTTGTVKGTGDYVGAVDGRNNSNDGIVKYAYYLQNSATCNDANRNGVGSENSSIADGTKGTQTAYFTSPSGTLSRDAGYSNINLITALNNWVADNPDGNYAQWVAGPDGYPLPIGTND